VLIIIVTHTNELCHIHTNMILQHAARHCTSCEHYDYEHCKNDSADENESRRTCINVTIILIVLIYKCDMTHSYERYHYEHYKNDSAHTNESRHIDI